MSLRVLASLLAATNLSIAAVAHAAPTAPPQPSANQIRSRMADYLGARERLGQFNGVILAMRDGKVIFERAYGWADIEQRAPNRLDTRFNVASVTKQFTAAAVLQLRDAGKLSLTDSICRFVDPCPEAWKPVTIKLLLNHTSGMPDYEEALELGSPEYTAFIGRPDNVERIISEASVKPLDFAPGSKWHYSNTGYILLARVVARTSGQSYERYVEDHLLAPAGMTSSSIDSGVIVPGAATGYAAGGGLGLKELAAGVPLDRLPLVRRSPGDLHGDHGDAALWTTAGDLARWVGALEGGRIISPTSLAEMKDGGTNGYGFGLEVGPSGDRLRVRHTGQVNGFVSILQWYPQDRVVLVAVSNYENGRSPATMRDLASVIFGLPYDVPRSHILIEPDLAAYAPLLGDYTYDGAPARLKVENGMLLLEVVDQFTAGLLPEQSGGWYVPFLEGTARQTPTGLVVHSRGRDVPLVRKP